MSSVSSILFMDNFFTKIKPSQRNTILSKLELDDIIKMTEMPNQVSKKFFDLCIVEDNNLTFPDRRVATLNWSPNRLV